MKKYNKRAIESILKILEDLNLGNIDRYEALMKLDRSLRYYLKHNLDKDYLDLFEKAKNLIKKYDKKAYREFKRRYSHKINKILNINRKITEFI